MIRSIVGWLAIAAVVGCGGSGKPVVGKVSGQVTLDGQPVSEANIVFLPATGRMAQGKVRDGTITEVSTFSPSDGVIAGPVKIAISPAVIMDNPRNDPTFMGRRAKVGEPGYVPPRYGDPSKSGLSAEIKKGKNELSLELTTN